MKFIKVLRTLGTAVGYFVIGISIGNLILGKNTIIDNIILIIAAISLFIHIAAILVMEISVYIAIKNAYIAYEDLFFELRTLHQKRYKQYFSSSEDQTEEYTKTINDLGNYILEEGKKCLEDELVSEKIKKNIRYIMSYTRKLLSTKQPIYNIQNETSK